jgi:alpha-tubulin suppressor-like RCC1 family protein
MTVAVNPLVNAVNTKVSGTLTPLEELQLASVMKDFDQGFTKCVANCAALPAAANNKGRWIFLQDVCSYRWSDGTSWSSDFTSIQQNIAFGWGAAAAGKIGDGTTVNKSSPVSVVGDVLYWCQVSAGGNHSIGISSDGTAWGWGCSNPHGGVGDGNIVDRVLPRRVLGGFTDWCQVSAGRYHSLGVRQNGTAWAWGQNGSGQGGFGTVTDSLSPRLVLGRFTDWCQVSAGRYTHSLGVRQNGTAWGWGSNGSGRLGDGTTVAKSSPVLVVGGFTDWCQVSAGSCHSLGVRQNGSAWAWGLNNVGQLGDDTTTAQSSPVSVVGGFTNWCQVSAGCTHSLGVRQNGSAWAWGSGSNGQLGDGTTTAKSSPVSVVGGFTDWCQVSAGGNHSVAVRSNGTAWAWGQSTLGKLGDNVISSNKSSPVSVVGGFTDWRCVSAGVDHSLAIRSVSVKGF